MIISAPSRRPESPERLLSPSLAAALDRLDLRSLRLFAGKMPGERRSKKRGQSVEFAEHRQYAEGDDPRFIDWNVLARLDRLFIKLFMQEEDLVLHLVVDASASMDTPPDDGAEAVSGGGLSGGSAGASGGAGGGMGLNKKLAACRLAAALGYIGLRGQNRVGMTVFGVAGEERPSVMPERRGKSQTRALVSFLLDKAWPADGAPMGQRLAASNDINAALNLVARSRFGKGVIVVLSDFFAEGGDACEPGLRALGAVAGAAGFDVYCLQVLSPGELEPERLGKTALDALAGDLRLTDVETGRGAEVTVTAALIREYKKRLNAYNDTLHNFCASRGIHHQMVRTDVDPAAFIAGPLRAAGVVA